MFAKVGVDGAQQRAKKQDKGHPLGEQAQAATRHRDKDNGHLHRSVDPRAVALVAHRMLMQVKVHMVTELNSIRVGVHRSTWVRHEFINT